MNQKRFDFWKAKINKRLGMLLKLSKTGKAGVFSACTWCNFNESASNIQSDYCTWEFNDCPVSGVKNGDAICCVLFGTRCGIYDAKTPGTRKIAALAHYNALKKYTDRWIRRQRRKLKRERGGDLD